jgi:hypothetical protein
LTSILTSWFFFWLSETTLRLMLGISVTLHPDILTLEGYKDSLMEHISRIRSACACLSHSDHKSYTMLDNSHVVAVRVRTQKGKVGVNCEVDSNFFLSLSGPPTPQCLHNPSALTIFVVE